MQNQNFSGLIKNLELIVEQVVAEDKTTFVLKQDVKLSEAFYFLPAGRINKMETGIGATHLELNSLRNSIVVEPLRITAQSKSNKNIFYYSASDKFRQKALTEYLSDTGIQYKKILVVIDSLPTLIDALKEFGVAVEDYFLLIDEIDSVQRDSTFRVNMENAIDIYEKFPEDKRALISATLKDFSKPELQNQPLTEFRYENKIKDEVAIIYSNSLKHQLIETLQELLKNTTDKIFVASNDIKASQAVAEELIIKKMVTKTEISFLLGSDSKNDSLIKEFSNETIKNNKLPTRLNFASSAYFSGYDLLEDYALVVVTNHSQDYSRYSLEEIVQIKGRCRKKLTSIHILASVYLEDSEVEAHKEFQPIKLYTVEQLKALAHAQLEMLRCQDLYTVEGDELNEFISQWRDEISLKIEKVTNSLVRKNRQGKYEISYLTIDAMYQNCQVIKEMYLSNELFRSKIETYFNVISETTKNFDYVTDKDKINSNQIIEELFEKLLASKSRKSFDDSINPVIKKGKEYKVVSKILKLGVELCYTNKSVNNVIVKQKSYNKLKQLEQHMSLIAKPKAKSTLDHFVKKEITFGKAIHYSRFISIMSEVGIKLNVFTSKEIKNGTTKLEERKYVAKQIMKFASQLYHVKHEKSKKLVTLQERTYEFVSNNKKQ